MTTPAAPRDLAPGDLCRLKTCPDLDYVVIGCCSEVGADYLDRRYYRLRSGHGVEKFPVDPAEIDWSIRLPVGGDDPEAIDIGTLPDADATGTAELPVHHGRAYPA